MKWVKRLVIAIVLMVLVLVGGGAIFAYTFDVNAYKQDLQLAVKEKTGRDLDIAGQIEMTYFPWLGMTLSGVTLSNPPSFTQQPFAYIDQAQASVMLLPLLSGDVQLSQINLIGVEANLVKKANGDASWEFPQAHEALVHDSSAVTEFANQERKDSVKSLRIGGVDIEQATIRYIDDLAKQNIEVTDLSVRLGEFAEDQPMAFDVKGAIEDKANKLSTAILAKGTLATTLKDPAPALKEVAFNIKTTGASIPGDKPLTATGKLNMDMAMQTLEVAGLKLSGLETLLQADLSVENFNRPKVRASMMADELNLDKLQEMMAIEDAAIPQPSADPLMPRPKADTTDKIMLPLDLIRKLDLQASLIVRKLVVNNLTLTDLNTTLTAKQGVLHLNPLDVSLYDGVVTASATLDARQEIPEYLFKGQLEQLQAEGLLKDLAGEGYVSAIANITSDLTTRGDSVATLKSNLNGGLGFDVGEGTINKWELSRRINQALAFFAGDDPETSEATADTFEFTSMLGSARIENGILRNNDFLLRAPKSHAIGYGSVNLGQDYVDYTVKVALRQDPASTKERHRLPIEIKGPFENVQYKLDVASLAQARLQEKLDEEKGRLEEKLNEKIQDKLGDVFNKFLPSGSSGF